MITVARACSDRPAQYGRAASECFAAGATDRGPVVFDCGGFGPEENRFSVGVVVGQSVVAGAGDRAPVGFVLAAGHFADAGVADRFSADPTAAAFARLRVAGVVWVRFSAVGSGQAAAVAD